MPSKRGLLKKFLKGIETGDAMAAAVVDETKYIQHNPQTREGGDGIAALFARISKTDPKVTFVRVFEDGEFAFAHNEYDFADVKVAFEVFRFENDRAVEHWDNLQPLAGLNTSGRSMTDGVAVIDEMDRTETNRALVREFVETALIEQKFETLSHYVDADLMQHDPESCDGLSAFRLVLEDDGQGAAVRRYLALHRVLAEGNFVLCMCEGFYKGVRSGIYDLYRVSSDRIVEHWSTIEAIPPRDQWKNDNGKF